MAGYHQAMDRIVWFEFEMFREKGMRAGNSVSLVSQNLHLFVYQEVPIVLISNVRNMRQDLMRCKNHLTDIVCAVEETCEFCRD